MLTLAALLASSCTSGAAKVILERGRASQHQPWQLAASEQNGQLGLYLEKPSGTDYSGSRQPQRELRGHDPGPVEPPHHRRGDGRVLDRGRDQVDVRPGWQAEPASDQPGGVAAGPRTRVVGVTAKA
jgi:hypothetical protein